MRLSDLTKMVECEIIGDENIEITSLAADTARVTSGCMFFCLVGGQADGHDFAAKARLDGAAVIVVERRLNVDVTQVLVRDARAAMALIAKTFYGDACDKLNIIAVVGTNGKTSTAYLINSIFKQAGTKTAMIGTNGVFIGDEHFPTVMTTPDPIDLHAWFERFVSEGVKFVIMEVSAHAIYYKKIEGLRFAVTVFTNFSQDHLDFFGNMDDYAKVKLSVFDEKHTKVAVVNSDDVLGRQIVKDKKVPIVTYGCEDVSDIFAIDYAENENGMEFVINLYDEIEKVRYGLHGKFNVYNILAAATTARIFGIKLRGITQGIKSLKRIDGRNETFYRDGKRIVIDFAHTPDGMENILSYLSQTCGGKLITVFGCGGNRDRFKRPIMAKIASQYSDFVIITDDNPRYENPDSIVSEILGGISGDFEVVRNRKNAITKAIERAKSGDTVAILGKGAEAYQEIAGKRFPYSDFDVLEKYFGG